MLPEREVPRPRRATAKHRTSAGGSDGSRTRRGGRRGRRRAFWVIGGIVATVLVLTGAGFAYVEFRFHQIHREHVSGLAPITSPPGHHESQAPYNVLLVGDNCRNCLDEPGDKVYGSAAEIGGGRSDVTMLLHVDPSAHKMSILSIPRDLWLPIPNSGGEIRVDAALNDGPGKLVTTIEDDLDIPINHYVELNFDSFKGVVNALGGVDMNFPDRVYDSYSKLNAPAGCYHLNGTQALEVVRARHLYYEQDGQWDYDGLGDISRIARDHQFLTVMAKAVSQQGLDDPITDNELIGSIAKDLTIDNTFTVTSLVHLAETLSTVDVSTAPERTVPVDEDNSPNGYVYDGAQYGDVVFPTAITDRSAIQSFLGVTLAGSTSAPDSTAVRVIDGSGQPSKAATVTAGLQKLGFHVTATTEGPVASTPSETVVYYAPGHEAAAQRLADELGGAVALGQDAAIAEHGLVLLVGSNVTVAKPAAAGAVHRTSQPPAATVIGGLTKADPKYPSFDPTGCTTGMVAKPLPSLSVPSTSVLPQT